MIAPSFDRGCYHQFCMEKSLRLREALNTRSKSGQWVRVDTIELRAAIFAIRAYVEYVRLLRRQHRSKDRRFRATAPIDNSSFALLKAKSHRVIRSLERHMKRANRVLIQAVGKEQYAALLVAWKAHLRWMRLHIAFYKPWGKPLHGRRKRQQRELDELMQMARRGLREVGYQLPDDKELRRIMRLYARYGRDGRQGDWTIQFHLEKKTEIYGRHHLAHFVIDRSDHKELSKS